MNSKDRYLYKVEYSDKLGIRYVCRVAANGPQAADTVAARLKIFKNVIITNIGTIEVLD